MCIGFLRPFRSDKSGLRLYLYLSHLSHYFASHLLKMSGDAANDMSSPNAEDITPDKDGGVLKVIKKEGIPGEHPQTGDKVAVHYTGTLMDGTKFDSSRDRDDHFEFTLGKKEVIKAWDLGVATMNKGELSVFTCKPEYAYGENGSPPKIPANATLIFEVELFSWKKEDLSEKKDGGIYRTILEKGRGGSHPNDGATCDVHIVGKHGDRVFDDREVTFILGEGSEHNIVPGIEQALKKFKELEHSRLDLLAYLAFGEEGNKEFDIPPNTDLVYEVKLKKFEKLKESWEMDGGEKLEQAPLMKERGTNYFKQGKYELAKKYYSKIVDWLEHETNLNDEEKETKNSLMLAANLNMAMCAIKLDDYLEAIQKCDKALEIDAKNEKALFRRGTANQHIQNYEQALADFQAVLDGDPSNKAAKNQLSITQHKIKQQQEKEKKLYAGMFQKFADIDAKIEKQDQATKFSEPTVDEQVTSEETPMEDQLPVAPDEGAESSEKNETAATES